MQQLQLPCIHPSGAAATASTAAWHAVAQLSSSRVRSLVYIQYFCRLSAADVIADSCRGYPKGVPESTNNPANYNSSNNINYCSFEANDMSTT